MTLMLIIPHVPYLIWLVICDSKKVFEVKDAEMRADIAEAEAREAEAQASIARATPLDLSAVRQG